MTLLSFIGAVVIALIGLLSALIGAGASLPVQFEKDPFFQRIMCQFGYGEKVLQSHFANMAAPTGNLTNSVLDKEIIHALSSGLRDVRVLGLPFGAGKTTAVERALFQLQLEKKISGVLHLKDLDIIPAERSLAHSVFPYLHLDISTQLSDYLPDQYVQRPLVLLFDQFERAQYQKLIRPFIVGLAEQSRKSKKFVVLLVLTDPVFMNAILGWNGGEKIARVCRAENASVYRWSREQLSSLLDYQHKNVEERDQLLDLAAQAGTPGFLISTADNHLSSGHIIHFKLLEQDATSKNLEWAKFGY